MTVSSSDANKLPNVLFEVGLSLEEVGICGLFTDIPSNPNKVVCTINIDKSNCQVSRHSHPRVVGEGATTNDFGFCETAVQGFWGWA